MKHTPALLMLGIGNSLRGDDGAGPWICQQLQEEAWPGVTVETAMQIYPEHLHQFMEFDAILVIDASVETLHLKMERIVDLSPGTASSHHQDLPTMVALGRQLFQKDIALYACHIPAMQFDMGQPLSEHTLAHAQAALPLIRNWIERMQQDA